MVIEEILARKGIVLNSNEINQLLEIINAHELGDFYFEKISDEEVKSKILSSLEILNTFGLGCFLHKRFSNKAVSEEIPSENSFSIDEKDGTKEYDDNIETVSGLNALC